MHASSRYWLLLLVGATAACKKTPVDTGPAADAAPPPPKPTARPAPAPSTDFEVSDAPREYKTYVGELTRGEPVVLALAKDGVRLEGILQIGGEFVTLRGEAFEDNQFALRDANPKGKTAVDGTLNADGVTAELLGEGVLKPVPFTGSLTNPFGVSRREFERDYSGNFGALQRLALHLKKKDTAISGTYKSSKMATAAKFEGEITLADGHFHAIEGDKKKPTGVVDGVFLGQQAMLGHWASADGSKKTFFDAVELPNPPAPFTFAAGRKLAPKEVTEESKFCRVSARLPELSNSGSRTVEEGVNARFRNNVKRALAEDCGGASEKSPIFIEQTYEMLTTAESLVAVRTHQYRFIGGAHAEHRYACYTIDTGAGATREATAVKLLPGRRALLEARVKEELKTNYGTLEGTCFRADAVKINDLTTLCVERKGALTVQFQMGEIGCYAIGAPRVTLNADEARQFVSGSSDFAPFFSR